jgi:hypothetical protein
MKYYASYKPETGKTHIIAYDEAKRGAPRIVNDHTTFLYHNSIIVSRVYNTVADALLGSLGKYSNRPVILPDGRQTTPNRFFGTARPEDVFVPWSDVKCERWPGDPINQN